MYYVQYISFDTSSYRRTDSSSKSWFIKMEKCQVVFEDNCVISHYSALHCSDWLLGSGQQQCNNNSNVKCILCSSSSYCSCVWSQMVMMAHFQNQFKKSPPLQFSLTQSHLDSNCSVKSNNNRGELMMIRARYRDSFPYCSWKYGPWIDAAVIPDKGWQMCGIVGCNAVTVTPIQGERSAGSGAG